MRALMIALIGGLLLVSCSNGKVEQKPDIEADIRKAIPDLTIDAINPSPIDGLYEVQVAKGIFYTDASGKHLIAGGHIFETASHRDLTRERLEALNSIDWNILPLDKAIVSGDANAPLKLAVFTDPDCPYCKKLEAELKNIQGVAVYTFLYPLTQLHPDARAKSDSIWCSKDQHQAMLDVMLDGKTLPAADCQTPLDAVAAIGQKLGINGTPTIIAGDGRMVSGGKPASELKAWLTAK